MGGALKEIAPGSPRSRCCLTRKRRRLSRVILNPFKAAATSLGMEAIIAPINDVRELETRRYGSDKQAE